MMKTAGLTIFDNITPNQCQMKIVIYGSPKHPNHFISIDSTLFTDHTRLRKFFKLNPKRWKYKTLKYKYPDILNAFLPRHHHLISTIIRNSALLKQWINLIIFPNQIWKVIHDQQKRARLMIIKQKLKVNIRRHKQEFYEYCHQRISEVTKESHVIPFNTFIKYGFLYRTYRAVIVMIGKDVHHELMKYSKEQFHEGYEKELRRTMGIIGLMTRLQQKRCNCCGRLESRNTKTFEKYKMCKCKKVRYCGRKCQKIHWKKMHRYHCREIII